MRKKKQGNPNKLIIVLIVAVITVFGGGAALGLKFLSDAPMEKRERKMQMVHLVRPTTPPPPPKIKEKPPEEEPQKKQVDEKVMKEEIAEAKPQEEPQDKADNEPPPGDQLGLDAAGGAGGDAFGLVGKTGGRSLIGGGSGGGGGNFGWYARGISERIQKRLNELLRQRSYASEENKKLVTQIFIAFDDSGKVKNFKIIDSSGNEVMDELVKETLASFNLDQPLPEGMPQTMRFKISPKG